MASEWRDLEQSFGRDANKLEGGARGSSFAAILVVWMAFYVIAVTHAVVFPRTTAPALTADASQRPPL
jgi:hypothetical protein